MRQSGQVSNVACRRRCQAFRVEEERATALAAGGAADAATAVLEEVTMAERPVALAASVGAASTAVEAATAALGVDRAQTAAAEVAAPD
eukprot:3096610-Pleurochrysis_carterae.AAC.2